PPERLAERHALQPERPDAGQDELDCLVGRNQRQRPRKPFVTASSARNVMFAPTLIGSFTASIAPSSASLGRPGACSEGSETAGSVSRGGDGARTAACLDAAVRDRERVVAPARGCA